MYDPADDKISNKIWNMFKKEVVNMNSEEFIRLKE